MPKEVTHWLIADEVCRNIAIDIQPEHRNVVLLGSVFHDVLYYYTKGDKQLAALPDKFHGTNREDSFYFVAELINLYQQAESDDKAVFQAFIIGFISHIFADVNFHPFVYYMTGNYYDPDPARRKTAEQKHREMESVIDSHFEKDAGNHRVYDINVMLEDAHQYLEMIFANGIRFKRYDVYLGLDDVLHAYNNFKRARNIYTSPWAITLIKLAGPLLPKNLRTLKELSYYHHHYYTETDVTGEMHYLDTLSGAPYISTLDQMKMHAVEDTLSFCASLPDYLKDSAMLPEGPSLETGKVGTSSSDMRYFVPNS